jgi:hypothetical protein
MKCLPAGFSFASRLVNPAKDAKSAKVQRLFEGMFEMSAFHVQLDQQRIFRPSGFSFSDVAVFFFFFFFFSLSPACANRRTMLTRLVRSARVFRTASAPAIATRGNDHIGGGVFGDREKVLENMSVRQHEAKVIADLKAELEVRWLYF